MLNHVAIMGRLTRDPELRRTGQGTPVANFGIAVDRDYTISDGTRPTDFFEVVAWKYDAEFVAQHFTKGRMIVVVGRLESRTWEKEGRKNKAVEIKADAVYFADSKRPEPDQTPAPTGCFAPPQATGIDGHFGLGDGPEGDDAHLPF